MPPPPLPLATTLPAGLPACLPANLLLTLPFLSHPLSLPLPSRTFRRPPATTRCPLCNRERDPTPPISLPPFPPPPRRHRPVRPGGIDNDTMQVPRHRDAWRWFPPFTRAGEPGQPRAAVRACARQCVYTTGGSERARKNRECWEGPGRLRVSGCRTKREREELHPCGERDQRGRGSESWIGASSFWPDRQRGLSSRAATTTYSSSPPPAAETRLLCALAGRRAARARAERARFSPRRFRAARKKRRRAYVRGSSRSHSDRRAVYCPRRTFTKRRHFVRDVPHTRENGGRRDVGGHQSSRTRSIRSRETTARRRCPDGG